MRWEFPLFTYCHQNVLEHNLELCHKQDIVLSNQNMCFACGFNTNHHENPLFLQSADTLFVNLPWFSRRTNTDVKEGVFALAIINMYILSVNHMWKWLLLVTHPHRCITLPCIPPRQSIIMLYANCFGFPALNFTVYNIVSPCRQLFGANNALAHYAQPA